MTKVVVIGAGGFGRELAWLISRLPEYEVAGFVDDSEDKQGAVINGYPVLGDTAWLLSQPEPYAVGIGIGIPHVKRDVVARMKQNATLTFPSFVAPTALIGDDVTIGEGVVICEGTIVTSNIHLADFVMLNLQVTVGHDCRLGEYVTVSPGSNLSGFTQVGAGTDIGTNVTVIPGKTIGSNSVIGASACVTTDIPSNSVAVGIPAKVIKQR